MPRNRGDVSVLGLNLAGECGQLCLSLLRAEPASAPCRSLSGVGFTGNLPPQMQADGHGHVRPGWLCWLWAAAATLVSGAISAELTMGLCRAGQEGC